MRGLPSIASAESFRVRRWDALVLGGALPGLVAAVRLAKRGARVLILEEDRALEGFQGVREPFLMTGAAGEQVLGACLRSLGVPLIDQRRFAPRETALQVVLPDARVDVGRTALTIDELTAWGLAKPETARSLLRALDDAAEAERLAMLSAPVVRSGRRMIRSTRRQDGMAALADGRRVRALPPERGLPAEVSAAPEPLRALFDALCRSLSHAARRPTSPEAQARLLGGLLGGAAALGGADGWLRGMLRRRLAALFGEFRSISGPIRLVTVAQQPGLALGDSDEIWAGRALILNAPRAALVDALAQDVPDLMRVPPPSRRRVFVRLRGSRPALPEAMGENLVYVRDAAAPFEGTNLVVVRSFAGRNPDEVDLLASAVLPAEAGSGKAAEAEIEAALRELLPFSDSALAREPVPQPLWDTDAVVADPEPGTGWPAECDVRLSSRPPIFALERAWLGELGFEGDLLLGWRAGDAIADELA
jgi:hypothetical protein